MKTEIVDISPTRKEIKIEIDADKVKAAYDQISDRYARLATVPGFRKGHAPRSVVRTRFKDEIRGEVLRELVPQALNDAIKEHALEVVGEPDVHLDENVEALNKLGTLPLSVHTHVEVLPEIQLGEYKGLEASRRVRPVTDRDVDRMIEGLRESSASLQPVEDRGSELGDTVTVNFDGRFIDEPDAEHIKVDDVDIELGGTNVQQEFNDNLLGVRPDEEKTFIVNYPEDFSSEGLAGKKVEYTAKITGVRRKELPEVDDEFARSIGEAFDSVSILREKVREDLAGRAKAESDNSLRSEVLRKLVEKHQFELPQSMVERQINHELESVVRDIVGRGIDPRDQKLNWQNVREQLRSQAEHGLRVSMLLESIADRENLDVTDEEIQAEIEAMAIASRQSKEQVRAALTKQGGERSIADRLRNRKALDLLIENARVTDEEWREETSEADAGNESQEPSSTAAETEQQSVSADSGS